MTKWLLFEWIEPLQKRVEKELPREERSFFRAWSVISPILLYYLVNTFFLGLFTYIILGISTNEGNGQLLADWIRAHSAVVSAMASGIAMLIASGVVFPVFYMEAPKIKFPARHKKEIPLVILFGMAAALCFNILFALLNFTGSSKEYAQVADKQFALPLWTGILLYGMVSPLTEEIVFRGIVYNRFYRQFGKMAAIIGSSLLFGIYHGNVVQAVYGFLLGMIMAIFYERYGSFIVPVLLHSVANICVYIMSLNSKLQQVVVNGYGCMAMGIFGVLLFWLLIMKKKKEL